MTIIKAEFIAMHWLTAIVLHIYMMYWSAKSDIVLYGLH